MRQIAKRGDIRGLILDAVDILLAKYGYKKMTMEDVTLQVGVGKGTICLFALAVQPLPAGTGQP